MSSLLQFWPTAQSINECIGKEAETLSDPVLLAVHRPMKFRRESLTGKGTPELLGEDKLLQEFLTEDLPSGNLLLPVVGSSGIGKSHAVRWLDAQLRRLPDHGKRHIILIPKSASLREVLRLILKDLEGPAYDEARRALDAAPDDMDDLRAREELRAKLIIALERRAQLANGRVQDARRRGEVPDKDEQRALSHAGTRGLQAFLGDPVISPYIVQGSLAKIAHRVTAGLEEGANPKTQFEEEDLQIPFPDGELDEASLPARSYYRMISRDTAEGERGFAVKLLNEVVDASIAQMMKLDGTRLSDIFSMIREQLLEEGKELVLLVEDFAAMAGIQGSLLDAMIKEAVHGGKQVRCTMRTALAVTAGYLTNRDTVSTRARFQWVLDDIPASTDEVTLNVIVDFIGGYLNAARCGRGMLETEFNRHSTDANLFAWIPRFEDRVSVEDEDRNTLEAFGYSSEGYALFPLNRPMIEQIAKIWLSGRNGKLTFNPRIVINHVLWDALREYREQYETGEFPPPRYLNFRRDEVDASVISIVHRQYPDQELQGRYLSLLRFWGGRPTTAELGYIPDRVYLAFGLKPLQKVSREKPFGSAPVRLEPQPVPYSDKENPELKPEIPLSAAHPADVFKDILQQWATGKTDLSQTHALRIRSSVVAGLKAYISWERELFPSFDFSGGEVGKRVYIPRARGGSPVVSESSALVTVAPDSIHEDQREGERTEVVLTLESLLRLSDERSPKDYDAVEYDIARYANFVEKAAPQAISYIRAGGFGSASQGVPCVAQALLVGARVLGLEQAHRKDDVSLLTTVFRPVPPADTNTGNLSEGQSSWERLTNAAFTERRPAIEFLLAEVAARQGNGAKAYAIDTVRLLQGLEEFRTDWRVRFAPELKDAPAVVQSFSGQMSKAPQAVRDRIAILKEWRKRVAETLGTNLDGPGKVQLLDRLKETLSLAERTDTYPATGDIAISTLRDGLNTLRQLPIVDAVRAVDAAADEESHGLDEQLVAVSSVDDRIIRETDRILKAYDSFLRRCSGDVRGKLEAVGFDLAAPALVKLEKQVLEVAALTDTSFEAQKRPDGEEPEQVPEESPALDDDLEVSEFFRRATELKVNLQQISYRMTRKQLANRLNGAGEKLEEVLHRTRSVKSTASLLTSRGLMSSATFKVAAGFRQSLGTVHRRLLNEPNKITDGSSFERILSGLKTACDELQEQCKESWESYVNSVNPKVDIGFLGRIAGLGQYGKVIARITSLNSELKAAMRILPTTLEEVFRIEQLANEIRSAWELLPSPEVHNEVKEFLDSIKKEHGAPLSLLTPQVLSWLEHEKLTESFSIQLSGLTPSLVSSR